ncbi:MAG: Na+/H+ antiporter [Bryobacterales bacterium]|nr:Na+/H+ antiporter [Bryobacterales bacterium]
MEEANGTLFTVSIFIVLLLIASAVAITTKFVKLPYTLALVIVGLIISPMHFLPVVHISPELILLIFLPALLFEAAWNLHLTKLLKNLVPILMLAVPGLLLSVSVVGAVIHYGLGFPVATALLFGSIICATDPVSVLALFKQLGLPKRLYVLVEGESLLNDGTAVVVFRILLAVVMGTAATEPDALFVDSLRQFGLTVFGGLAVGGVIGAAASKLTGYFDDHLLEITLTTIAAYGSFLLAESIHVSPVIAVVVAGIIIGTYGRERGMSPATQVSVNAFWEYAAFVVNSLVFLLIGLEIQITTLAEKVQLVGWAVAGMLLARMVSIYGLTPLANRFSERVPLAFQHVLFWGGLRGSLSVALVLSLPRDLPLRNELTIMTFGAVVFSLLVQGLSIPKLLRRLHLTAPAPERGRYETVRAQMLAEKAALAELDRMRETGSVSEFMYARLSGELQPRFDTLSRDLAGVYQQQPALAEDHIQRVEEHLLKVRKARVSDLLRDGLLSEEAFRDLHAEIDRQLLGGSSKDYVPSDPEGQSAPS